MSGPDFFDDMIEQDAAERRRVALQEAEARNAQEAEAAKVRAQNATERTMKNNRILLLRDYELAGVRPPFTYDDGTPRMSLPMLRKLGWEVQNISGEAVLVEPKTYRGLA